MNIWLYEKNVEAITLLKTLLIHFFSTQVFLLENVNISSGSTCG